MNTELSNAYAAKLSAEKKFIDGEYASLRSQALGDTFVLPKTLHTIYTKYGAKVSKQVSVMEKDLPAWSEDIADAKMWKVPPRATHEILTEGTIWSRTKVSTEVLLVALEYVSDLLAGELENLK